jgi:uncharacterized protein YprB with RNaseH-like and TPR domain
MLRSTFCHVDGIGSVTERRIWESGCHTWEAALDGRSLPVSASRRDRLLREVEASGAELAAGNARYFGRALPASEHWRLFREFGGSAAYIDIETTGLGGPGDHVTTIAMYDGRLIRHYVYRENLADFARDIAHYPLIVTFNGRSFDVPFLRHFLGVHLDQAHIDLRFVLAGLGYRGGLKNCERQFGLDRKDLADVDGYFAVLLWRDYERNGDTRALETLLAYNILDVVNLAALMPRAYNLKMRRLPLVAGQDLPLPDLPELPFRPDADTIQRIRREHAWGGA